MLPVLLLGSLLATGALPAGPPTGPQAAAPPTTASPTVPAVPPAEPDPAAAPLVQAKLATDVTAFVPGDHRWLGVALDIADGWHVYAHALNDTGAPVDATIDAPAGYCASRVPREPMPQRHVAPGRLLDHVYERQVTLLLPVAVPVDARPGTTITFRGHVDWFVCREACVPGSSDVSLAVPIVATEAERRPSPDQARLRSAAARLPRPLPDRDPPVTSDLQADLLRLRAAGAAGLTFVPEADCAALADVLGDADRAADSLALHLLPQRAADTRIVGALEVRGTDGSSTVYAISVPAPPQPAARSP